MTIWNQLAEFEATFITTQDGVVTRIVRGGLTNAEHRPVLMLHGRGGHLETFRYNLPELAKSRTVIAVDLLGHGLTAHAGEHYSVAEIAHHVDQVAGELDDGRGFDLVGQSLGAWAGILANLAGAPFHEIALIEPAGLQSQDDRMSDDRVKAAFDKGGQAFEAPTTETVRLRFAQLLHDSASCDDEMVELRRLLYSLPGATEVHKAVRVADNEADVITGDQLRSLKRPLLLIRGEFGHIPTDVYERAAAAAAGSVIRTVPRAKQWPHFEQPHAVNQYIVDHFER